MNIVKIHIRSVVVFFMLFLLSACGDKYSISVNPLQRNFSNSQMNFIFGPFVDSKFIVVYDSGRIPFGSHPREDNLEIFYSQDIGINFHLMKYENDETVQVKADTNDYFNPFLAKGRVCALHDSLGSENIKPSVNVIHFFLSKVSGIINRIYSSDSGNYAIALLSHDDNIYFLHLRQKRFNVIRSSIHKFNSVIFSKDDMFLILSYDSHLVYYSIVKNKSIELVRNIMSPKLNPSVHNNEVYFVMNDTSEFYQIYKVPISNFNTKPVLVKKSNHDLRLPKVKDNYLYFITIIRSEYLLKCENLSTLKEEYLTTKGVVYNYKLFLKDKLVVAYSDFYTPRNIFIYNLKTHKMKNISGNSIKINIKYRYIHKSAYISSAYLFKPDDSALRRGIILFIHPGLNADFSPRWDKTLTNLTNNGYTIIAPNYPMSCGYGKKYRNQSIIAAVSDIINWENYIKEKYPGQPLYLLSFSSGNIIMELVLHEGSNGVKAAASFFGIPADNIPEFSLPILYILGKNDPYINYETRDNMLKESINMGYNLKVLTFGKEGHWFRKAVDIKHSINSILSFWAQ